VNGNMNVSPKMAVFGITILVALIVGWFMVISPKRHEATSLSQQIDDTRTQIALRQGANSAPQGNPIRVADLFELSRAMPDHADIAGVLLQLSAISAETGVTFQSITPHDPTPLGSYESVGIDLVFQGHFYDLSDFLYRLRNLVGVHQGVLNATGRLFTVDSINFAQGTLAFPNVKALLTVTAYMYGDGTADPVPAGASGTESAAPGTTTTSGATPASAPASAPVTPASAAPAAAQPVPAQPAAPAGA
jgi:Tfp pilus assembly protein PilO